VSEALARRLPGNRALGAGARGGALRSAALRHRIGGNGALADAPGWWRARLPRLPGGPARALRAAADAMPPPGLILLGIVSLQVGAGLAKILFGALGPSAVVTLRLITSALVLSIICRHALRGLIRRRSRADLAVAATFGIALATMNFSIYQAMWRLPLGIAVTIEFLGPLAIAIIGSRRRLDLLWVAFAAGGMLLFARTDGHVTVSGVGFALLAAACWAAYIMLSAATGRRFEGSSGLAAACIVGAVMMLPVGAASAGTTLLRPEFLLLGAAVGLLSSVIPYTLELEALRRVPPRVFGILMSLEPAVAALVGLILLGEVLDLREWLAIGLVVLASAGATRSASAPRSAPEP
jgi:inner membrane transporter RhtA